MFYHFSPPSPSVYQRDDTFGPFLLLKPPPHLPTWGQTWSFSEKQNLTFQYLSHVAKVTSQFLGQLSDFKVNTAS